MKVALIGCGFIGQTLANAINSEMSGRVELIAVCDERKERARALSKNFDRKPNAIYSPQELFSNRRIELVIEAASQNAVRSYVPGALNAGKHVMIMSVGALADEQFYAEIKKIAQEKQLKIYIPSGATTGLDWLKAASKKGLESVIMTIRKPPKALEGSPFVVKNKILLESIRQPMQIYEGPAADAALSFPANVNIAIAVSLAGIGPVKTLVRIIADPTVKRNVNEVTADGAAGKLTIRVENVASPANPKTSWLAALSAVQKLREITECVSLGS